MENIPEDTIARQRMLLELQGRDNDSSEEEKERDQ